MGSSADVLAYQVIFVAVLLSVVVQGGSVPAVAARTGVPMLRVEPRPWSIGVRLRDQPNGVRRHHVRAGKELAGQTVRELHHRDSAPSWSSFLILLCLHDYASVGVGSAGRGADPASDHFEEAS